MSIPTINDMHPADIARFWIWVEKGDGCWEWQKTTSSSGYATWSIYGRTHQAHRLSWIITNGSIPEGMVIDHMCHNILCVKPEHLRLATQKQNLEHLKPVRAKSGFRGVHKAGKKWQGYVRHHGKMHHTIMCATPEQANEAVIALRNELFTHNLLDRLPA